MARNISVLRPIPCHFFTFVVICLVFQYFLIARRAQLAILIRFTIHDDISYFTGLIVCDFPVGGNITYFAQLAETLLLESGDTLLLNARLHEISRRRNEWLLNILRRIFRNFRGLRIHVSLVGVRVAVLTLYSTWDTKLLLLKLTKISISVTTAVVITSDSCKYHKISGIAL